MRLTYLLVAGVTLYQHVSFVSANVLAVNPKCQKNACLSAVQSNRHHSDHKEWLPGCTSFFRKTVTRRPATKTIATGAKHTITKVVTKSDGHRLSITDVKSDTKTIHKTVTVTVTASAGADANVAQRDDGNDDAKKKTCRTAPTGPSKLPSYASACQNTVAYSSACQCVGVPHGVTTLPRCTSTITVKSGGTVTTTKTVHVGASETITVATRTHFATKTLTDHVTKTVTVPKDSSSTSGSAIPTGCSALNAFNLLLNSADGSIKDDGISETQLAGSDLGILTSLLSGSPASFKLDDQGHLLTSAGKEVGVKGALGTTLNTIPLGSSVLGKYTQPTCLLAGSACDLLNCNLGNGRNKFAYCKGTVKGVGKGLALVAKLPTLGNCKLVNVTVAAVAG